MYEPHFGLHRYHNFWTWRRSTLPLSWTESFVCFFFRSLDCLLSFHDTVGVQAVDPASRFLPLQLVSPKPSLFDFTLSIPYLI